MRVAVLNDIHGNAPALEAVLAQVPGDAAIVVGGDIVGGGESSRVLARLRALGDRVRWLRGNAERQLDSGARAGLGRESRRSEEWLARQLSDEERAFLRGLPGRQLLEVAGLGEVLFCHGSPRSDVEVINLVTPEERLRRILAGIGERTLVVGHTHHQFDRVVAGIRVVNAGSVGMAYEGRPGAHWALLGPDVELRRTDYDVAAAVSAIRASGRPDADELVELLTEPPTAAAAADFFEQRALVEERG